MSLRLILIRHAKSDWATAGLSDHARPLADRGRHDAPRMGAWLKSQGQAPTEVLCSDSRRTKETLALMKPEWDHAPDVRHMPELYSAPPAKLLEALRGARGARVAIVAHNPGIGALAAQLAAEAPEHPKFRRYPTASVTVLEFEAANWADVRPGSGRVLAFAVPADLG